MIDETEAFRTKLDALDRQIREARARLTLAGIFDRDHIATADEIARRLALLRDMLDGEVASLEARAGQLNSFQKEVLIWLNRIGFDR
jgi:hypothetical protein